MGTSTTPAARRKIEDAYNVALTSDMPHNLKTHVMDGLRQQLAAIDSFKVTGELPKRGRWRVGLTKILATCFRAGLLVVIAAFPRSTADSPDATLSVVSQMIPIHLVLDHLNNLAGCTGYNARESIVAVPGVPCPVRFVPSEVLKEMIAA